MFRIRRSDLNWPLPSRLNEDFRTEHILPFADIGMYPSKVGLIEFSFLWISTPLLNRKIRPGTVRYSDSGSR